MKRHLAVTLLCLAMAALGAPAGAQTNQPEIPRGGGMFPDVPLVTMPKSPSSQPQPPGGGQRLPLHRGDRPIIIVTPGYPYRGDAAGDERLQAVQRALRGLRGIAVSWIAGSAAGQVTPVSERIISGMNCRDLNLSVTTLGDTQEGTSTYCLTPAGEWLLIGP